MGFLFRFSSYPYRWFCADSNSPTFSNMVNGQVNLRDAIRRQIDFELGGKQYKLVEKPAVLIVRCVYNRWFYYFFRAVLTCVVLRVSDPEDGTWMSPASPLITLPFQPLFSTLPCISITMPTNSSSADLAPISTFLKWSTTLKLVSGTTFSASLNLTLACLLAQFARLSSSRPFLPHSRWRKFCSS